MKYLGTIFAMCFVVFAMFAFYHYTPKLVKGAQSLTASVYHIAPKIADTAVKWAR